MTPRFLRLAALFYGLMAVAGILWNALRGRETLFLGDSVSVSLALGALTAGGTVSLGLLLYRLVPLFRRLSDELAPQVVDRASPAALVLISFYSGVGEEIFFRGAVQPEFGLVVAAVAFGLVHVGPDRRYLVWTAWALGAGFLFGLLYEWTGGLLAPVLAHVLHNAVTLLLWKRQRSDK
jgi:membrane protease YdiL (CAAX protease family)